MKAAQGTKTKVARRGFTLVPDFACTGFMIQGQTLNAEIADCGDIVSLSGLTEMITSYVILSRVRKADHLLLMRAFSPYLFRLGDAPGPACLLKLLRHKFTGAAQTPGDNSERQKLKGAAQIPQVNFGP